MLKLVDVLVSIGMYPNKAAARNGILAGAVTVNNVVVRDVGRYLTVADLLPVIRAIGDSEAASDMADSLSEYRKWMSLSL